MSSNTLPATFEQRVKERISGAIADLIPEQDLDVLVRLQLEHFQRTALPELIKAEITAQLMIAIKEEFKKPEYQGRWAHHAGMGASEAVKKIIEENAGAMLSSMMGSMVQMTVNNMMSNMPRY